MRLKDIGVTSVHVLPRTMPHAWRREVRQLYGEEIAASDATFTVFMRDEPIRRDPQSVQNLPPKLHGNITLSLSDAEHLIDVILETWHFVWVLTARPSKDRLQAAS